MNSERADDRLRVSRIIARMNVGGPAAQASVLVAGLDPTRFESRLLAGGVGADEADFLDLRARSVPLHRVTGLGRAARPLDDARALMAIVADMRRFRPHIVHTHTAKAGVLGRLAAVTTRVPARVHTFHGHLLHGYFSRAKTQAIVSAERALARSTTRIVAVGARVRDELVAAGIGTPEKYTVIAPGVGLRKLPALAEARRTLGLVPDGRVIAYVGRLIPVKRPDRFIDVAVSLAENDPDLVFLVAGDGESRLEAESRARPLGRQVRFLGWRADVETIYAAADVVVLTSDNEGMPVSLIEAAHAGKAAVTTDVGSASEVVIHGVTGLVTQPSARCLTAAVRRLLDDAGLRKRMGAAARERAQREFSPERLIADTERLYEEIAEEKELLGRR